MLLQHTGKRLTLSSSFTLDSLLSRIPGTEALNERNNLQMILQNDSHIEGVVQGFVSPVYPERSVVAFVSMPGENFSSMLEDWASAANGSGLYGSVSLFTGGRFHSVTLGQDRYQIGSLDTWPALQYWARRYYWLSPLLIFACLWLATLYSHRWLEQRAAMRLQVGR